MTLAETSSVQGMISTLYKMVNIGYKVLNLYDKACAVKDVVMGILNIIDIIDDIASGGIPPILKDHYLTQNQILTFPLQLFHF